MYSTEIPADCAAPVRLNSLYCSPSPGSFPTSKMRRGADLPCLSGSPWPMCACFSSAVRWWQNSKICMKLFTWGGAFLGYLRRGNGRDWPGRCARRKRDPLRSCTSSQRIASRAPLFSRFRSSSSCKTEIKRYCLKWNILAYLSTVEDTSHWTLISCTFSRLIISYSSWNLT